MLRVTSQVKILDFQEENVHRLLACNPKGGIQPKLQVELGKIGPELSVNRSTYLGTES